jgi:hypothetical protein
LKQRSLKKSRLERELPVEKYWMLIGDYGSCSSSEEEIVVEKEQEEELPKRKREEELEEEINKKAKKEEPEVADDPFAGLVCSQLFFGYFRRKKFWFCSSFY